MRKLQKLPLLFVLAALALAACAPAVTPTPLAAPTDNTAPAAAPTAQAPAQLENGCLVASVMPSADPVYGKAIPLANGSDHVRGNPNAKITVIEYGDFQWPMCGVVAPVLAQLSQKYPQDVRVIFRHFPLSQHPNSATMAYGTEAAALQGKFFEMEEAVFAGQQQWATLEGAAVTDWLVKQAQGLGLDTAKFKTDLTSDAVKKRVDKNLQESMAAQLPGTPTIFINGLNYDLQLGATVEAFSSFVELAKLDERAYKTCPPTVIDKAKTYEATLKTDKGDIVIRLLADKAPVTVNSFVFLAREKFFNGVTFHRVLPGFVAQAGDPSGTGMGGPGYKIIDENQSAKYDKPGLVGMANSGQPTTNGSQFFITYAAAPNLNGKYTIFGEVIQGMDVAQKLSERDPSKGDLPPGDKINEVIITEK